MSDVFIQIIPNFYSSKASVEFTTVCFDRVHIICWSGSKPGFVLVNWWNRLEKVIRGRWREVLMIVIQKSALCKLTRSPNFSISSSLKREARSVHLVLKKLLCAWLSSEELLKVWSPQSNKPYICWVGIDKWIVKLFRYIFLDIISKFG